MREKKHHKRKGFEPGDRQHPQVNAKDIVDKVIALAKPVCESEGMELIHVEFQRESAGRILRLYIDKPHGINLDDCVVISRQMGDVLDVNLDDIGPFNLEVTSPGPARPLSTVADFKKFKGNRIKIKTNRSINGQKNFKGILLGISDGRVNLQRGEQVFKIPNQYIRKAHLDA
ncbi:MAG: ribosome maturation factor RimP [Desulfobacterales bacterium]